MIYPNAKPMACGGCGSGLFRMYSLRLTDTLLVECTECKSVSSITASRPEIKIGWTEGSTGRLTVMEPKPEPKSHQCGYCSWRGTGAAPIGNNQWVCPTCDGVNNYDNGQG